MPRFRFTLYIAGDSPRSVQAAENLRRLGAEHLDGDFELAVVDVVESPERAESERILTTPTLVREMPTPPRRVTGDLSDPARVLVALALRSTPRGDGA